MQPERSDRARRIDQAESTALGEPCPVWHAAAALAVDPRGLGGLRLRGPHGPLRDAVLARLDAWFDGKTRRLPSSIGADRLLGGLDWAASLRHGRRVAEPGLIERANGDLFVLAMAERWPAARAALIAAALDRPASPTSPSSAQSGFAVVLLDESAGGDDPEPAACLCERLAFDVELPTAAAAAAAAPSEPWALLDRAAIVAARKQLADVTAAPSMLGSIALAAERLGVRSMRAAVFALRAARALAALRGACRVDDDDLIRAIRLCLVPRALQDPTLEQPASSHAPPPDQAQTAEASGAVDSADEQPEALGRLDERVLDAVLARLPPGLLTSLANDRNLRRARNAAGAAGASGARRASRLRGRPIGTLAGMPRGGDRLQLIDTLRAAAPWQPMRRAAVRPGAAPLAAAPDGPQRLLIERQDLRIARFEERRSSTTIFVVDASGSAALHRLAEAKGAVELLLADCYARRDRVAVLAFRATRAELLLAPTRSLVRAKRALAGLPGGGGTPLALALDEAGQLGRSVARAGDTPLVVVLSDGRANVARDGSAGREQAHADAMQSARRLRAAVDRSIWIDIADQPQMRAQALAAAMGARYLALPRARAEGLAAAVRSSGVRA